MMATMSEQAEYTFNVTQEHIDHGVRRECGRCPVALAIAEEIRGVYSVMVGDYAIQFSIKGSNSRVLLSPPHEATKFINDFDEYGPSAVAPFTFTARVIKGAE